MWRSVIAVLVLAVSTAHADQPPPYTKQMAWDHATRAASAELAACKQLGMTAKVYGDVEISAHPKTGRLSVSASKSLGPIQAAAKACVRDAIARHLQFHGDDDWHRSYSLTQQIGLLQVQLPPPTTLLPVWRRVVVDRKRAARAELVKLLPPDYTLAKNDCIATKRQYVRYAEYPWLDTAGSWVSRMWVTKLLRKATGLAVENATWDPHGEFVVQTERALCLVPFDAKRQAALRADFDTVGTCWAGSFGDILLRPRFEFPKNRSYTSVDVEYGRACAVDTSGAVTCCGNAELALPPAPKPVTSIALGHEHACGLDAAGEAVCWGKIAAPPPGKLTKLSSEHTQVCGLRANGELACWGSSQNAPPAGAFVDVAATGSGGCGVRVNGSIECWGERIKHPHGTFTAVSVAWSQQCGVRADKTLACWFWETHPIDAPTPERFKAVTVGGASVCGRRDNDTVACWHPPSRAALTTPPPTNSFTQLAGGADQYCGVRANGLVECWGNVWPGDLGEPYRWRQLLGIDLPTGIHPPMALAGRVLDEWGKPIAGAEVLVCSDYMPCSHAKHLAIQGPSTLGQLVAKMDTTKWPRAGWALVTTDRDGGWKAPIEFRPTMNGEHYSTDRARILVAAPGRELRDLEDHHLDPKLIAGDHTLRPASTLDIVAKCGLKPCTGKVSMLIVSNGMHHIASAHVERLAPGTHTIGVRLDDGQAGERVGSATVEVTYTPKALRAVVQMKPAGLQPKPKAPTP